MRWEGKNGLRGWSDVWRCLGLSSIEPRGTSLGSFTWKKIEPKGKGPCPRRRQCCCIVGDKIVLFGGTRLGAGLGKGPVCNISGFCEGLRVGPAPTSSSLRPSSPSPEEGLGDEFDLIDHSDLHILDFSEYFFLRCLYCQVLSLGGDQDGTFPALTVLQLLH